MKTVIQRVEKMASTAPETGSFSIGVAKVKQDLLKAFMTCQICHKLVTDATTISECLHTFCRKCIFEKLADEEVDHCPICNIDPGCNSFKKLRWYNLWNFVHKICAEIDGNLPISYIQKYLTRKLDISNESKVEIMCQGQTVSPAMTLQNVADLWFQTLSSDIIQAPIGSSAKDLVMDLVYSCKVPAS